MNKKERKRFCKSIEPFLMNWDYTQLVNMFINIETENETMKKELNKIKKTLMKVSNNIIQENYEDVLIDIRKHIEKK